MERQPVDSSAIASVGYDRSTATLEVEFRGGATYQYLDVPERLVVAFRAAPSLGRFHADRVKGVFRFVKT